MPYRYWVVLVALLLASAARASAADNVLTPEEKQAGWKLLFDGTLDDWMTNLEKPSATPVQEGAINPHKSGGYMVIHKQDWSDFILAFDFKLSPKCNSGVFIRTFPLKPRDGKDIGYNGIEVALDDTTTAGFHDSGALYDLVAPKTNAMKPVGEWNHMQITCDKNLIRVELNGKTVTETDLDQWTEKNKRPDGSDHKFDIAFKEHPRHGYLGFQDHGGNCWFKNVKLKPLDK
jgi:hypothetical protein